MGVFDRAAVVAGDAEQIARSITDPDAQVRALAGLVGALAAGGALDRAEQIARSITDPYTQVRALTGLVEALASAGVFDRAAVVAGDAEQIARSITDPDAQVRALAGLVGALAAGGALDRAEQITRSITDPDAQARALTDLASFPEPTRARMLIVEALAIGKWTTPLQAIARCDSTALTAFVAESRFHQLQHPTRSPNR